MIDRVRAVADQFIERDIVVQINRVAIGRAIGLQGRGIGDPVRQPHARTQNRDVPVVVKEIGVDHRRCRSICRAEPHSTPAFRTQHAGMEREAVSFHIFASMVLQHSRNEVPLHIGRRGPVHNRPEPASLGIAGGHRAGALAAMFEDRARHPERTLDRSTDRNVAGGLPAGNVIDMVLQVRSDRSLVEHNFDAVLLQMLGRTNARKHEDLRGVERARRQYYAFPGINHLRALAAPHPDSGNPPSFDHQSFDKRVGADREVTLFTDRLDIGAGSRPTLAIALGHLVDAKAFLPLAVEVASGEQLQRRCAFDKGMAGGIGRFLVRYKQRPAVAVIRVGPALIRFGLAEIGQYIVIAPAGAALRCPIVVIPLIAADIDHRVDCGGAAKSLAARLIPNAPVQAFLRDSFVLVVRGIADEGHEAGRLDQDIVVAPAGLKQAHPPRSVDRKPPGYRAAAAATADDNVIEAFHDLSL